MTLPSFLHLPQGKENVVMSRAEMGCIDVPFFIIPPHSYVLEPHDRNPIVSVVQTLNAVHFSPPHSLHFPIEMMKDPISLAEISPWLMWIIFG